MNFKIILKIYELLVCQINSIFTGSLISLYGKIYTDAYGSNVPNASNGKTVKMLRNYVGGQKCDLKNGDDL